MPVGEKSKVLALLEELHISYQVTNHPAVYTIEEMELLQIDHMDRVVKNLFIRDDKKRNYYLVMLKNDKSANLKELRHRIDSKPLTFASEDDLKKYLGLGKGEVSPFGVINDLDNDVIVIIDNDLRKFDFIGVHPNDNTATVYISMDDLIRVFNNQGHKYMFADL